MELSRNSSQLEALSHTSRYLISYIDFDIGLTYIVQFFVSQEYLQVMIEKTYFDAFKFRQVEDFKIVNVKLA